MFQKAMLLALTQIFCFQVYAQQVDLSQFMDASIFDGLNPFEYQKIKFSWNMSANVQVEMNEGLTAMDQDQLVEAIPHFDQVLKLHSDFGPGYYYRSICHKNQRNFSAAEYDMIQASRLMNTPECFIELGDIYYLKRNISKARESYKKAVKSNPGLVVAYYKLGCLALNLQDVDESIKAFEKCNQLDPGFVKAYLQLGLIKMRFKRDNEGANQLFTKAIRADSTNAQAYFWRSFLYLIKQQNRNALKDLDKTVELAPSNPYFRLIRGLFLTDLKEFDKAFSDLRKALVSNKVSEGRSQFGQTILDKKIDLQNAGEYLNRVLYGYDDLSSEFLKTGFCLLIARNYHGAIENFDRVYRLSKSPCEIYLKALTFEHMGKHSLAYHTYSDALLLDEDIFDAYKKRAIYRGELKEWDGVLADLNEMRRLQPGSPVTNRLSGFLKYNHADYSGSIIEMDTYLKQDSTDVEALKVRADSKSKVKDFYGAISDFNRAIALSEEKKDLENLVIENTVLAGDTAQAVRLLIEFSKAYHLLRSEVLLAELYIETKDFKKAESNISLLEKALKNSHASQDNMAFVHYLKSRLKSKRGLYADALEQINKCLKLSDFEGFVFQRAKVFFQLNQIEDGRKDLATLKKKGYKEAEVFYTKYGI
jgi:tetratricopeptide (TPR) repeat protein